MTTTFFYTTGGDNAKGIEYTSAQEIFDFLKAFNLSIDDWRNTMYETVKTPLAWGEMRTAREIYDLIIEVYTLAHRGDGRDVLN